jgi:TPR repeat protein
MFFLNGKLVNYEELLAKAEQGDAEAQELLGRVYDRGNRRCHVRRNRQAAVKWWTLAAENGHTGALLSLSWHYHKLGQHLKALELLRQAADAGDLKAYSRLGNYYWAEWSPMRDKAEAIKIWKQGAELGDALSANRLGKCYYNGDGVEQDYHEAVRFFRMCGEKNFNMVDCYLYGHGVEKNVDQAVEILKNILEDGRNWSAMFALAHIYSDGIVTEPDYEQALHWWKEASDGDDGEMWHGSHEAQYQVARYYYEGKGVEKNLGKALQWFELTILSFREQNRRCSFSDEPDHVTDARRMLIKHGDKNMTAKVKRAANKGSAKAIALLDELGK